MKKYNQGWKELQTPERAAVLKQANTEAVTGLGAFYCAPKNLLKAQKAKIYQQEFAVGGKLVGVKDGCPEFSNLMTLHLEIGSFLFGRQKLNF